MKRKLVSGFLSAALLIACLPATALADTGVAINEANFPDAAFRDYVKENYDTDTDGKLSSLEIEDIAEVYIRNDETIKSLTGIKNFTYLETLTCYGCANLTSVDVSGMTSLVEIYTYRSGITSINVSGCTSLDRLWTYRSYITSLDASGCSNLTDIQCYSCKLNTINVSGCTSLNSLDCSENNISSLNLTGLGNLYYLNVSENPVKYIFVGNSPALGFAYSEGDYNILSDEYYWKDGSYEYWTYEAGNYYALMVDPEDTVYGCTQRKPDLMPELPSPAMDVGDFVTRCYNVALGRNPETNGFNNYVNNLEAGKACGGQVAHNFIFSQEYINKNKSNEAFVDDLYQMFFDRSRGAGEGQAWINELDAGVKDREQVFNGFVNSQEYFNLCKEYGITAGYYVSGVASSKQGGVNCFVERLYEVCLGRRSDIGGQKTWASGLMAGTVTGSSCVHGFLFSAEFTNKNLNDFDFVAYTYRAFFGREADVEGLTTWMNYLGNGGTREGVFNGFVGSQEFKNLCSSYGINP